MSDDLGDRMKAYETMETGRKCLPLLPIYARVDGRGFSKFTKGMSRPFDERMSGAMIEMTRYIIKHTNARMGYTQSDEASFVWMAEDYGSEVFFDGKLQKLTSVVASMATAAFTAEVYRTMPEFADRMPHFDCRVFQVPNQIEAANAFLWRELDATKNAISMAASHYYSHKELQNMSGKEKQEMLFQKGVNFNDYPAFFKRGTFVRRNVRQVPASSLEDIPEQFRPTGLVTRAFIEAIDMPKFKSVSNRVDVIFNSADPIVIED